MLNIKMPTAVVLQVSSLMLYILIDSNYQKGHL